MLSPFQFSFEKGAKKVNYRTYILQYLCFSLSLRHSKIKTKSMTQEEKLKIEERIVEALKTVYDPEIPVNIYDLGLIYKIDLHDDGVLDLDMTFTAPACPAADFILEDVRSKMEAIEGITTVNIEMVFDPAWDQSMMSEEARVELGFE